MEAARFRTDDQHFRLGDRQKASRSFIPFGRPVVRMGAVSSTMDIVRRLEQLGAGEGIAVVADSQSAGRGRSDRAWVSPSGRGWYCSLLLRPQVPIDRFQAFSIATGLAVCEALDPTGATGLQLKWPNDILRGDRKLAGILVSSSLSAGFVTSANVGIGINLHDDQSLPPTAISLQAIHVAQPISVSSIEPVIFRALAARYGVIRRDGPSAMADWPARLAFLGEHVTVSNGSDRLTGIVRGLDESGALLLETSSGLECLSAGDLTRGPQPA